VVLEPDTYSEHVFRMDKGDILDFHVAVVKGSPVDVMVFIERDFNIYSSADPNRELYAEKKLLEVTNVTRSYRETGNYGPYNIYLVVDNTNITDGATPTGSVTVYMEATVSRGSGGDSPGFSLLELTIAGCAAAVVVMVGKKRHR
jgi:hypothetical protein